MNKRIYVCALMGGLLLSAPVQAKGTDKKGFSLGKVAESQQAPERRALDEAVRLVKREKYQEGAQKLFEILSRADGMQDEAKYNLAKALYRIGHLHSALGYFSELLGQGPKSRYYRASLEWCLFIGRKMTDDVAVNQAIARFGNGSYPEA